MQVNIDGVPYAPACESPISRIGIAITTHTGSDYFCKNRLQNWPPDGQFFPLNRLAPGVVFRCLSGYHRHLLTPDLLVIFALTLPCC